jgi:ABC-type multidrug transport system ATPase subunit
LTPAEITAVNQLSLAVPEGSVYGFIGPNRSGKSTTMRMITNIIHPDSGTIRVFGEERSRTQPGGIGYLPEERGESLCDSILMIFRGNKVLDGTLASIQSGYGSDTIREQPAFHCERLAGYASAMSECAVRWRKFRGWKHAGYFHGHAASDSVDCGENVVQRRYRIGSAGNWRRDDQHP